MTGSLQEKHGKYYVVIRSKDSSGKTKQKWISTQIPTEGNNKRRAQNKMKEILLQLEEEENLNPCEIPFTKWIDMWLEIKQTQVRRSTFESYTLYNENHIQPYFKKLDLSLRGVTPQHIQSYYNKLSKKQSANTIKKHHVIIHGALNDALVKNMIPFDPSQRVTLPKQQKRFVGKAYSAEQANTLLSVVSGNVIEPAVILGLYYGLRRSEVLGLRWKDIDFDNDTISIRNTVVRMVSTIEEEATKSNASRRTMFIIPATKPYLKELRKKQNHNRELFGREYFDSEHVCVWNDGRPLSPDYVSHAFKKLLTKNDLPPLRFHELRHTAGSLLLASGLSIKQIQEYLGHEQVSTTLDIYGHLTTEGKKEAANKLNSTLIIYP